ncbi:glycosyltransferase family protein [Ligilactobacillus sp. WILCCON 0076]|uniref:Glycosyltransferase family protein n=1 Tax=Ligilactobacillus ubinensis TaxID=2876789 RepID=A0A9X2FT40_9LACO|nr:glycosyltransferase [Ligilactobacillus ubinensis]MCP0888048.1 glycosyltransferase family protein [Ligilactobacillus ubinensis]
MRKNPVVAIVVIINNYHIFNEFKNNLDKQKDINYKLICIDNCKNQYHGAREAFNSVKNRLEEEYILFIHPDIRFLDEYCLKKVVSWCESIENLGVLGIAGCKRKYVPKEGRIFSNIVHGKTMKRIGTPVEVPIEVQTVDECFFVIKNDILEKYPFSDLNGWHLYAVEQCLKYNDIGLHNYVVPANIWHISDGKSLDFNYILQLKSIIRTYGKHIDAINTTVKNWKLDSVYSRIAINYYLVKQLIKYAIKI